MQLVSNTTSFTGYGKIVDGYVKLPGKFVDSVSFSLKKMPRTAWMPEGGYHHMCWAAEMRRKAELPKTGIMAKLGGLFKKA